MIHLVPVFDDGRPVFMFLRTVDGAPFLDSREWRGEFAEGTHTLKIELFERVPSEGVSMTIEVVVSGTPTDEIQELRPVFERTTVAGLLAGVRPAWKKARFVGATRPLVVHVHRPDGSAVEGERVFCGSGMVKTNASGEANCGFLQGTQSIDVVGCRGAKQDVSDEVNDVNVICKRR